MKLSERKRHCDNNLILRKLNNIQLSMKERIEKLEEYLKTFPQVEVPLEESFGYNLYVREIMMPAGSFVIGAIHKYKHLSIMLDGELVMWTEFDGLIHLKGFNKVLAEPGIKRVGYVLQDTRWLTAHGMDASMEIGDMVPCLTVTTYAEYTKFKNDEMSLIDLDDTLKVPKFALARSDLQI